MPIYLSPLALPGPRHDPPDPPVPPQPARGHGVLHPADALGPRPVVAAALLLAHGPALPGRSHAADLLAELVAAELVALLEAVLVVLGGLVGAVVVVGAGGVGRGGVVVVLAAAEDGEVALGLSEGEKGEGVRKEKKNIFLSKAFTFP